MAAADDEVEVKLWVIWMKRGLERHTRCLLHKGGTLQEDGFFLFLSYHLFFLQKSPKQTYEVIYTVCDISVTIVFSSSSSFYDFLLEKSK